MTLKYWLELTSSIGVGILLGTILTWLIGLAAHRPPPTP